MHLVVADAATATARKVKQLIHDSHASDVFAEVSYIDKVSKLCPVEWLRHLERVTFDDRVIYNAINFVRDTAKVPERRAGLLADMAGSFKEQLFHGKLLNGATRFHYTDIRFEPLVYMVMQKVASYTAARRLRLTSESWEFLRARIPDGAALINVMSMFVLQTHGFFQSLQRLLGSVDSSLSVFAPRMHRVAKQLTSCPAKQGRAIARQWKLWMQALSQEYDRAMASNSDSGVQRVWLRCFDCLRIVYCLARALRYAAAEGNGAIVIVAGRETIAAAAQILKQGP